MKEPSRHEIHVETEGWVGVRQRTGQRASLAHELHMERAAGKIKRPRAMLFKV
jgi:hypothetical protein